VHELAKSSARNAKDAAAELQGLDNLTETVTGAVLTQQRDRVQMLGQTVTTLREQRARFQGARASLVRAKELRELIGLGA